MGNDIAVIIPAYNAAWCIADAVASALAQGEVSQVVVIDDASSDATVATAREADDGSGRLQVFTQDINRGPAAARNRGIAETTAPLIALLDADDRFAPGRFAALLSVDDKWDFIADDILFVKSSKDLCDSNLPIQTANPVHRLMGMAEFVERNMSRRQHQRSELGFLKPVMRRDFLKREKLRYVDHIRLGEDFILYATALARNAQFRLVNNCGYYAIEHEQSLSSQHSEGDLMAMSQATVELSKQLPPGDVRTMLERLGDAVLLKSLHRQFLSLKRDEGLAYALTRFAGTPWLLGKIGAHVLLDKISPVRPGPLPRRLFSDDDFEKL